MKSTSKDTHIFISTSNCFISGGVEALLKNGALLPQQQIPSTNPNEMSALESLISEDDFMTPISSTSNHGKPNFATSLINSVKSSTASIESQLRGMAIRAASNETKSDVTCAYMYYSNGNELEEIGCTEFKNVLGQNEQYCIPIVLPDTNIDRIKGYLQVRIVIKSGAQVLGMKQNRQYVIATSSFPLSRFPNTYSTISSNASSNFIAEGVITLTILPDVSNPTPFRMGWSLTDPNTHTVFNSNLVKPYHYNHFLGIERSIESTLTLPLSTAITEVILTCAKISANHSIHTSTKLHSHFMMYKDGVQALKKGNVEAQLNVYSFMKFSERNEFQGNVPCRVMFRSPVDIFEQELGSGDVVCYSIPVGSASNLAPPGNQPFISIPFYPPVSNLGTSKKIGVLRFDIPYEQYSTTNNNFLLDMEVANGPSITAEKDSYQGYLDMDAVVQGQMVNIPIFSHEKQQIGLLTVFVSARTTEEVENEEQRYMYADGGLLQLMGLQDKIQGTDTLDRTLKQVSVAYDPNSENSVRYRQLNTMGHFLHPSWLRKHAMYRIQCVKDLEKRFESYLNNITSNEEIPAVEANLRKGPACFRPSSSKSEVLLSGIPFNVHVQSMTVEKLAGREEVAMFSNVTCGAPADHARGFTANAFRPAGGLLNWEKTREDLAIKLHETKSELIQVVASYFTSVKESGKGHYVPTSNATVQNVRYRACELEQRLVELTWELALRRANCFSQALSIATTSFLSTFSNLVARADCNKQTSLMIETWLKHGFLLVFEGLLSAAGKETGMIEDATVAIDMLAMAGVMLICDQKDLLDFGTPTEETGRKVPVHGSQFIQWIKIQKQSPQPNTAASNVTIVVQVGLTSQYFNTHVPMSLRRTIVPFYPMLFQMGVDIRQWGANAGANFRNNINEQKVKLDRSLTRRDTPEDEEPPELSATETCDLLMKINQNAFRRLNLYAHQTVPLSNGQGNTVHPIVTSLWQYIENAHGKMEHGVLDACAQAASKLGGGSIVFCKSGKDRTAMQVTYKQAQFIHKFICMDQKNQEQKQVIVSDSTLMRLYGTRLMICEKNVGQFKYAFNALQAKFMPDVLKPPPAAMAGFLKGGRVFSKEGMIES